MSHFENTLKFIENGKKGRNKGFSYSINELNRFVKIWEGRYYLIFALSGVGKSKFVYHQHIFNVIDQQINHNIVENLQIDLYSLEISPTIVTGIMMIYYLQEYKNIITDTNQLFSYDKEIYGNLYKAIHSPELKEYMSKVNNYLNIYTSLTFPQLKTNIEKSLAEKGTITKDKNGYITNYESTYKQKLYQIIIDHISLSSNIGSKTKYESIGVYSKYLFAMRNITGITPVMIQQVNPDRSRKPEDTVSPSHEDLRDNKETFNDCDIGLAIGSPFKHKIRDWKGYKIYPTTNYGEGLQDRFRFVDIRKNRYGNGANQAIPTLFIGETSSYNNLAKPDNLTQTEYLKINNIKKTYD